MYGGIDYHTCIVSQIEKSKYKYEISSMNQIEKMAKSINRINKVNLLVCHIFILFPTKIIRNSFSRFDFEANLVSYGLQTITFKRKKNHLQTGNKGLEQHNDN